MDMFSTERAKKVSELVIDWQGRKLVWGLFDCLHLVCDMAQRLTNKDYLQGVKDYDSKKTAIVSLKELGFNNIPDALTANFTKLNNFHESGMGDIISYRGKWRNLPSLAVRTSADAAIGFMPKIIDKDNIEWDNVVCYTIPITLPDGTFLPTGDAWRVV